MQISSATNSNSGTPYYSFRKKGNVYQILEQGRPMRTGCNKILQTPHRELAEEIVSDLYRAGPEPGAEINMYTCLMSLIDFSEIHGATGFISKILVDICKDPMLRPSALPHMMALQHLAFNQPYFKDIDLQQKIKDGSLLSWAAEELATWSMEEIHAVIYVTVHTNYPLIGMAIAQDRANLEYAAPLLCGILKEHRQSDAVYKFSINIGEPDVEGFNSGRENLAFCSSECLSDDNEQERPKSPEEREAMIENFRRNCGVVIGLDVLRRFAAFGRKVRLGG